jgi:hypothetical protein
MTQHRLYGLRGKDYFSRCREILESDREAILAAFNEIVERDGKFAPRHLGELCNKFKLPVKVMDEFLPKITNRRYSSGTWKGLQERGCTAEAIGVVWSEVADMIKKTDN